MQSFSLSVALFCHVSVVVFNMTIRVSSCQFSHVLFFFFLSFTSLAVFYFASAFNSDISKWNTGVVSTMVNSKCNLCPSLFAMPSVLCFLIRTTRVSSDQFSHVLFFHVLEWYFCCCSGLFSLSLLHSLLQLLIWQKRSINCCALPTGTAKKVCLKMHKRIVHVSFAVMLGPILSSTSYHFY